QKLVYIPVASIHPHPDNPRRDVGDVAELAASIAANGILQNLTVVKGHYLTDQEYRETAKQYGVECKQNQELAEALRNLMNSRWAASGYTVIIGHRRLAAAKLAGVTEVPCTVAEMSHKEQVSTMLTENMQRADLTVYEQAQGFQMMLDLGSSVEEIAKEAGFSPATVRRRVKLLELDQDQFKASEARGATLADYIALDKITDRERKNKVLKTAGTANFNLELKKALEEEELAARQELWEAEISKWATKIEAQNKVGNENVPMEWASAWNKWTDKGKTPARPADTGTYYYTRDSGGITVYRQMAAKTMEYYDKDAEERQRRNKADEEKKAELEEITERHYRLRRDFIKNFGAAKSRAADIMIFAINALMSEEANEPDPNTVIPLMGTDDPEEMSRRPEYGLLVIAWACLDRGRCYWDWEWITQGKYCVRTYYHEADDTLDYIYQVLESLGYQMSDEEQAMQDGTHEVFKGAEQCGKSC
ncbi:MAG: ParB/RepB/Spo0J family partition protein, partial [Oscillospiraceae bacterium]|nr:ParB/RepB/Spo0J family partition protein [Oscillospiraceae bacterium]